MELSYFDEFMIDLAKARKEASDMHSRVPEVWVDRPREESPKVVDSYPVKAVRVDDYGNIVIDV